MVVGREICLIFAKNGVVAGASIENFQHRLRLIVDCRHRPLASTFQFRHRHRQRILIGSDDAQQIALVVHVDDAVHRANRFQVNGVQFGVDMGLAKYPAVQHPVERDIVDECAPGKLVQQRVMPGTCPDYLVLLMRFRRAQSGQGRVEIDIDGNGPKRLIGDVTI